MPHIVVSVALADQVFIKYGPSLHAMMPGKEIERIVIKGGAGRQKQETHDAKTGKKRATAEECEFVTTNLTDEQFDWLQDETAFQDMVEKGWLRAMPISEREIARLTRPHHIEAEVEHLIPLMREPGQQKDRQLVPDDFINAGKKFETGGAR